FEVTAMRGQIALYETAAALHERNTVIVQDLGDFIFLIVQRELEHVFQQHVCLADTDGKVEFERHTVFHQIDRLNHQWLVLHLDEPGGKRSPDCGDIELAVENVLYDVPGLV